MPYYRYRHLTPEEQASVVRQRQAMGYPYHGPPHPFRERGYYFITAANYKHVHIMQSPGRRTQFEASLFENMQAAAVRLCAWCILPNHYHLLVEVEQLDDISHALKKLHGASARQWNLEDGLTARRKVWYRYTDSMIRDEGHFYRVLNYIHINPLKHAYVPSPYDWQWSSLALYVQEHGRDWLRALWNAYPIREIQNTWEK